MYTLDFPPFLGCNLRLYLRIHSSTVIISFTLGVFQTSLLFSWLLELVIVQSGLQNDLWLRS